MGGTDYIFANPGKSNSSAALKGLLDRSSGLQGYQPKSKSNKGFLLSRRFNGTLRQESIETASQKGRLNEAVRPQSSLSNNNRRLTQARIQDYKSTATADRFNEKIDQATLKSQMHLSHKNLSQLVKPVKTT